MESVSMAQSHVKMAYLVVPADTNPGGTLHGGKYLSLMDEIAYGAAMKFCRRHIVTGQFEGNLSRMLQCGQLLSAQAMVIHAGRASMVVWVQAYGEDFRTDERFACGEAFFTCVAVDDKTHKPVPVPELRAENEEQQRWIKLGAQKAARFKASREDNRADKEHLTLWE